MTSPARAGLAMVAATACCGMVRQMGLAVMMAAEAIIAAARHWGKALMNEWIWVIARDRRSKGSGLTFWGIIYLTEQR